MAEGKWTVQWCEHYHGWDDGAWVVSSPDGQDQDCHWDWAVAMKWVWEYIEEEMLEAFVAQQGRGWPSGE